MKIQIHNNSDIKLKVLLLLWEGNRWKGSKGQSYTIQLGFEEGLIANGAQVTTLTSPWFSLASKILNGKRFDQVWVDIVHGDLDEAFLKWVGTLAPVRLGLIAESLQYSPEEYVMNPALKARKEKVKVWLKYMTHVLAGDENDVDNLNRSNLIKAMWWVGSVPKCYIFTNDNLIPKGYAIFTGWVSMIRKPWLEHHELKSLIFHPSSPDGSFYPAIFDIMHTVLEWFLRDKKTDNIMWLIYASIFRAIRCRLVLRAALSIYIILLRQVRRQCFTRLLKMYKSSCCVINLLNYFKGYSGRVFEAAAAGSPVISYRIPNRTKTEALFKDGEEILLFDNPDQLVMQIRRLKNEAGLGSRIANNARRKIIAIHTMELRVKQILDWILTGDCPDYS